MDPSTGEWLTCTATRIAPAAREWLSNSVRARVYHIFERVCNLIDAEGGVLTLLLAPAEMNPLALEVEAALDFRAHLTPQVGVRLGEEILFVGNLAIRISDLSWWDPSPDWRAARVHQAETEQVLVALAGRLIADHVPESLAIFVLPGALESPVAGWQERARKPVQELLHCLRAGDYVSAGGFAAKLAGLGMGLTPGGDDFIIGVIHALWCALPPEQAGAICTAIARAAAPNTNQLSAKYITRAALGEASEPWHVIVAAMARGNVEALQDPARSLMGVGHTSGQDALGGFILALEHLGFPSAA